MRESSLSLKGRGKKLRESSLSPLGRGDRVPSLLGGEGKRVRGKLETPDRK
jgi:hypothetical protein